MHIAMHFYFIFYISLEHNFMICLLQDFFTPSPTLKICTMEKVFSAILPPNSYFYLNYQAHSCCSMRNTKVPSLCMHFYPGTLKQNTSVFCLRNVWVRGQHQLLPSQKPWDISGPMSDSLQNFLSNSCPKTGWLIIQSNTHHGCPFLLLWQICVS